MPPKKNVSKCFGLSLVKCNANKKCMYVNKTLRKYCKKKTLKANIKKKSGGSTPGKRLTPSKNSSKKNKKSRQSSLISSEPDVTSLPIRNEGLMPTASVMSNNTTISSEPDVTSFMLSNEEFGEVSSEEKIQLGEYMAICREKDAIRDFFEFPTFRYAVYPIKRIGGSSNSINGFIKKIRYKRGEYSAYALLKSSLSTDSDNLAYEYEVGLFINKICNVLPCFVETYRLYYYKSKEAYEIMSNKENKYTFDDLNDILQIENDEMNERREYYRKACETPLHIAVLTEHLGYTITLKALFKKFMNKNHQDRKRDFLFNELPKILFQVYYGLAVLAMNSSFTHYDLHWENVLLYELPEPKYVNFEYKSLLQEEDLVSLNPQLQQVLSGPVLFQTRYVAKIIDYGRCYYRDNETGISSLTTYRTICGIPECEKSYNRKECDEKYGKEKCDKFDCPEQNDVCFTNVCGKDFGFSEMAARFHEDWVFNPSCDLRLLTFFGKDVHQGPIDDILNRLDYDNNTIDTEIKQDTYKVNNPRSKISTVVDAARILERFVKAPSNPLVGKSVGTIIVDGNDELQYKPPPEESI